MSQGRLFPLRAFRAMVARLGFPLVLLVATPCLDRGQQRPSVSELLHQFETTTVFWRQFEIAKALVAANDATILPTLQPWLTHEDRHLRGNAAFVFAGLGNSAGFDVIVAILSDRSKRPVGQGIATIAGSPEALAQLQIAADRYYAAHLLGDLKDPHAVSILAPLLTDREVDYIVPWSLAQIGDRSAVQSLIWTMSDRNPSMRVLAIHALENLKATEALPRLRQLLGDNERCNFDRLESLAEAAQAAIAKLQSETAR